MKASTTRPNRINKDLNSTSAGCALKRETQLITLVKSLLTARHIKLGKESANRYDWIYCY